MKIYKNFSFKMNLILWFIAISVASTFIYFLTFYTISESLTKSIVESDILDVSGNKASVANYYLQESLYVLKKSSIQAGIITFIIIMPFLIPFIFYLSRKLTTPIKTIADLASKIAVGNFDKRINYPSNNEIGILAKSFNTMADKLQNTYVELSERIDTLNAQKEEINLKNLKLEQVIEVNKTILEQLEEKNKQLEQASRVKTEFLATMSHEFRTPMNSIIGYTEMILDGNDGDLNEEQKKDLNIILKSSEKLLSIINNVLDLSKIEAGKMTYRFKKFNLIKEISELIENIKVMSQSKGLDLIFEYPEDLPEIYSDPEKINNIVSNILSNAVKFTDTGHIKISLSLENDKFVNISIEDTGIGIPENEVSRIFDEFKQVDGSSTRKYGGTGLGLAIVKAFTEGLGGSITVTSKIGVGSVFTVKIPVSKSSEVIDNKKVEVHHNVEINIHHPEQEMIAVITRNSNNYNAIKSILSEYNFKVIITDYAKAIETIRAIKPSCIFIDIDLPCSNCNDGWLTLSDLRQDKAASHIPIIVVSTQPDSNLSFVLGATDYLAKPFSTQDILKCITRCLVHQNRGYVLLINENKDTFSLLSKVIRKNTPYSVLMASSPKEIYNVLDSSNLPRLIIIDATALTVKPIEIMNTINSIDLKRKIPVISISERDLSNLEQDFLRQHSKKFLVKSDVCYSKLVSEIKRTLNETA